MKRDIVLYGQNTGNNYVYAESIVAIDRLPKGLRDELVDSNKPIGRLWSEHGVEDTLRELLHVSKCSPPELLAYFSSTGYERTIAQAQLSACYEWPPGHYHHGSTFLICTARSCWITFASDKLLRKTQETREALSLPINSLTNTLCLPDEDLRNGQRCCCTGSFLKKNCPTGKSCAAIHRSRAESAKILDAMTLVCLWLSDPVRFTTREPHGNTLSF